LGQWGGSKFFNGSTWYLTVPLNAALNPGTGDFTLEYWVYFNALNTGNQYNAQTGGIGIGLDGSNRFLLGQSYVSNLIADTVAVTTGQWYHVAVSRSGTTLSMFVNGSRRGSISNSTNFSTTLENRIGWNGGAAYFSGYLSNLRIVKGTAVYDPTLTTLTVPTAPLTAITNTSLLITGTGQGMFNNSTFVDQGPKALTVTATGAPVYSGRSPFGNTYPGSVLLNGSTQYLTAPNNAVFQFGTGDFTAETWIYLVTKPINGRLFSLGNFSGAGNFQVEIPGSTGNDILIHINGAFSTYAYTVPLTTWFHIAVCRVSGTVKVYINGTSLGSNTQAGSVSDATNPFAIGAQSNGTALLNGYVSNLRIVKGTAVYTANFTPSTTPLTAITNTSLLVRGDTGAFYDLSNNGLAETGVGTPVVTTQVKKFGNESGFLNGSSSYLTVPNTTALQMGTGDYTVEFWMYQTSVAGTQVILEIGRPTTSGTGFQLDTIGGVIQVYGGATTGTLLITAGSTQVANQWYYIALTRSGSSTRLFINGTQSGSTATDSTNYTQAFVWIGANGGGGSAYFNGYLDDIRITKGVARYTANFTPPTATFPTA